MYNVGNPLADTFRSSATLSFAALATTAEPVWPKIIRELATSALTGFGL